MSQGKMPTVLLVEPDPALRRIIVLGLEHRGMNVVEVSAPIQVSTLDMQPLDLIVLDLDGSTGHNRAFREESHALLARPQFSALPTVLLAWEYPPTIGEAQSAIATITVPCIKYLTKPFDARILHENIDQLLLVRAAEEADREARAEELLLARYAKSTAPSVWPIVTAAGLLLAFIGMMLQFTVTIAGILIMIIALLWWTLEKKPEADKLALSMSK